MTCVTPTPTSPSAGVPATKFGIAIGSGTKSPSGIATRFCANASRIGVAPTAPSAATPEMICRRFRRSGIARNPSFSVIVASTCCNGFVLHLRASAGRCAGSALSLGKDGREIFPLLEECRRQVVGLALDDRAQRALLVDAQIRRRRRALRHRHAFQLAVAL